MNIDEIIKQIAKIFPDATTITYEEPKKPDGFYFIDIELDEWIVIQYSNSEKYFGLFLPGDDNPFSKPDEIYYVFDELLERIKKGFE